VDKLRRQAEFTLVIKNYRRDRLAMVTKIVVCRKGKRRFRIIFEPQIRTNSDVSGKFSRSLLTVLPLFRDDSSLA
jgi:hypothetical protein